MSLEQAEDLAGELRARPQVQSAWVSLEWSFRHQRREPIVYLSRAGDGETLVVRDPDHLRAMVRYALI